MLAAVENDVMLQGKKPTGFGCTAAPSRIVIAAHSITYQAAPVHSHAFLLLVSGAGPVQLLSILPVGVAKV